jgi:threonine aldolase
VLYALDHHMERLAEDHANARTLASIIDGAGGATVVPPDTNIVMIDVASHHSVPRIVEAAKARGVLISDWSATRIRLVTHLDVNADNCRRAGETIRELLEA